MLLNYEHFYVYYALYYVINRSSWTLGRHLMTINECLSLFINKKCDYRGIYNDELIERVHLMRMPARKKSDANVISHPFLIRRSSIHCLYMLWIRLILYIHNEMYAFNNNNIYSSIALISSSTGTCSVRCIKLHMFKTMQIKNSIHNNNKHNNTVMIKTET